ncbi:hypothetical protein [Hyphococcus sp.]|uniref:hypothetical protein n=1 Tax=Hyphococcus sp. TaxID=2038636 RepID=UPI0035C74698
MTHLFSAIFAITAAIIIFLVLFRMMPSAIISRRKQGGMANGALFWSVIAALIIISAWAGDAIRDIIASLFL